METMEEFECNATAGEWDYSFTGKGNEQIAVECRFTDGPMRGQSLTWYGNFGDTIHGDKTRTEWTKLDLMKMGWDGKDWLKLDGIGSKTFRVRVEPNTYNGKTTMQVRRILGGGGLAIKADARMTDAQKRELAKKLAGARQSAAEPDYDPFK